MLFDPYAPSTGYPPPRVNDPNLIVVSHDHSDHNAVDQVNGRSTVVRGIARRQYGPLILGGSIGWHDDGDGAEPVSLTLLEWSGRRLAHFGDLGKELEPEQESMFQGLDLLMMPCGGDYTLGGERAARVVQRLRPRLVAPMHYATPFLNRAHFPKLESAESFVAACKKFARVIVERSGHVDLEGLWSQGKDGEVTVLHLQHQMA